MEKNYFIHSSAIVDEGAEIASGVKVWHFCHIMPGSVIGENCNIGQNVVISPKVILGRNVKIQNNVSLYEGVICEDDVFLGPSMVFTNGTNPGRSISREEAVKKTIVKKGASIGANSTIVCGHTIGEYAFIGAGAVVTKDVAAYSLVVGNPAKPVGWMSEHGMRLKNFENNIAVCPESRQEYLLQNNVLKRIT